jgi:nucleoside-diphosphate-sugar epimerase
MKQIILVAGATGNLGLRIVKALATSDAEVRVIVRAATKPETISMFAGLGVKVFQVKDWTLESLKTLCTGATCVVSVLSGLREVIIDAQKVLLDAAIAAGVPRFIPSDYSLNFTKFKHGENRNLDLRREFHQYLDTKPIAATSIFNGAFADMITGEMPVVLAKQKLVLYWGNADYRWGFTSIDNTATYTALVALDNASPRQLNIAGDQISPREIKDAVIAVTGDKYRLFRPGGQGLLGMIIKIARKIAPAPDELYSAWQGMQYMHNMVDPRATMEKLDNDRYPAMKWTTIKDVLTKHQNENN